LTNNLKDLSEFAQEAARLTGGRRAVGDYIRTDEEEPGLRSYIFQSTLRGYLGWFWSISEVVMMPGADSLVAPNWVPWSERLADYKALQAELEAQAALDAEEAAALAEGSEDADDDDEDDDEVELEFVDVPDEDSIEQAEEKLLASTEFDVEGEPEDDADDTGKKPPRFFGWKSRRKNKKNG
jgi:hypothetical protein